VSGKHSRDKGSRGERELADIIGADKVSAMYQPGPDLLWNGRYIEVKRRAHWPSKALEKWRRDAQIVMFRVDREPWMCYLTLDTLLDMIDEFDKPPACSCCGANGTQEHQRWCCGGCYDDKQ